MVGAPAAKRIALAASGVIGVFGLVYSVGARGGDWSITPRISVSETFSDNANLATDSEDPNSDFITQISPGLGVRGTGARGNLNFDYSRDESFYHRGAREDSSNNSLAATGAVELWKQALFVDGQASISRAIEDSRGATSTSVAGQDANRTESRAFSVSPYLRHHFGPWVETETRFTYSGVMTESDTVEDNRTQREQVRLNSGRRFTQLQWSLTGLNSKTINDGDEPSSRERRVDTDFTFIINRFISLLGGVGYEDIEDTGLTSQPSGLTYNVGFALQPSPRTSVRFTAGERNGDTNYDLEATHSLSSRTTINATYSESIQTSQQLIDNSLAFLGFDQNNQPIDIRNGAPFGSNDAFGLTERTFRQRVFDLSLNGTRRRNTFRLGFFWEERETESTATTETALGGNFNLSRELSPRLNGSLGFTYRATDFGTPDERTEDEINASTSLSYQVRNDIRATLTYDLTLRKVNNAPDDLMENSVTLGLTKSF